MKEKDAVVGEKYASVNVIALGCNYETLIKK